MLDPIIRNTRKKCNGLLAQLLDQGQKNVIVKTKRKTANRYFTVHRLFWSRVRDPNPPPAAWEAAALPDELTLHCSLIVAKQSRIVKSGSVSVFCGIGQIQHRSKGVKHQSFDAVCHQQTLLLAQQRHHGAAFQQLTFAFGQQGTAGAAGLLCAFC